jgi:hypothetical protein
MVTRNKTTRTTTRTTSTPSSGKRKSSSASTARALAPALISASLVAGTAITALKVPTPAPPTGAPTAIVQAGKFSPACTMPFNSSPNPAADDHCGIAGDGTDTADQQEAIAKNNFCSPTAHPQDVTYDELLDLQKQAAEVPIPKKLDDRKEIQNLGEGNYVSYVALIMDAHYSDTTGGEKVNCNMSGNPPNDIHIVLVSQAGEKDECTSTTAEMSPHYRPTGWTPQRLNGLQKPVRIRGQLFYDNSHAVCGKSKPNPKRASLWEIHPVYSIDVCNLSDLDQCRKNIDNDAQWTPIT